MGDHSNILGTKWLACVYHCRRRRRQSMISPCIFSKQSPDFVSYLFRIYPRDTRIHAILRRVDTVSETTLAVHGCIYNMRIRGRYLRRIRHNFVHIGCAGETMRGRTKSNRLLHSGSVDGDYEFGSADVRCEALKKRVVICHI